MLRAATGPPPCPLSRAHRQIMSMANMKDAERLELLKEIGGTKVYEERRRESLKIMQDTENRRAQVGRRQLSGSAPGGAAHSAQLGQHASHCTCSADHRDLLACGHTAA